MRKTIVLAFAFSFVLVSTLRAQHGSEWRKEYEQELNGPHGECEDEWKSLRRGLDYRAITCLGGSELDMHVVRIDLERWRVDAAIESNSTAREVASDRDAPFAINANFFDTARRPLGAVVTSGEVVRAPKTNSWQSIFLITSDGRAKIIVPSQWSSYRSRSAMAVQAGPRLVVDGHTNRVHQSYAAARAGVCIRKGGELLFFATPQNRKFDMYEIARIARRGGIDGGLGCHDAMLFDGGHSVNLYVEGDGRRVRVDGDRVPVFVFARPRSR